MIDDIVNGIVAALYGEFGVNYRYYIEQIEQDFETPCFSILCVEPSQKQMLGRRYLRQHLFNVNYFPGTGNVQSECHVVLEKLFSLLELIMVDNDVIRGTNMGGHIEDNVLVFHVNYNFFVHSVPVTPETDMSEIEEVTERVDN